MVFHKAMVDLEHYRQCCTASVKDAGWVALPHDEDLTTSDYYVTDCVKNTIKIVFLIHDMWLYTVIEYLEKNSS